MVALSVNHLVRNVEEQTVVRVFLVNEATQEQKTALESLINSQPELQTLLKIAYQLSIMPKQVSAVIQSSGRLYSRREQSLSGFLYRKSGTS